MFKAFSLCIGACCLVLCSVVAKAARYDGACMNAPVINQENDRIVVRVSSEPELQQAMISPNEGSVIVIAPGEYKLTSTLWVKTDNITLRGDSNRCDEVVLVGKGMEDAAGQETVPYGVWTNAARTRVQNLTISDVYHHAISIDGYAEAPEIYNVRMLDSGEQFIKSNPRGFGRGVDNGSIKYSVMRYTINPPESDHGGGTGYTGGLSVHAGSYWLVSNNRFENFHTPDDSQNLWNPAVLMWNGATQTLVQNNQFVDVGRAIAFGLRDRPDDHTGGIIRNNMILMQPDLFSDSRKAKSDSSILVWSSTGTQVLHNTIITQGNINNSIELRFNSSGSVVKNNLVDAPIRARRQNNHEQAGNVTHDGRDIFKNLSSGDLHIKEGIAGISGVAPLLPSAARDFDGDTRGVGSQLTDVGADEYRSVTNAQPVD